MFWRKQKQIEILIKQNEELDKAYMTMKASKDRESKKVLELEKEISNLIMENEKLINAIKDYGDLQVDHISIPYLILKKDVKPCQTGIIGEIKQMREVTKVIPTIEIHYIEEV